MGIVPDVPASMTGAGTKLLLVDDEVRFARTLGLGLGAQGYEVTVAPDGRAALELAAQLKPEVVLLDLGLPDLDGVGVVRRMRSWMNAPIIVLSARHEEASKVAALDAGADDYVTKPFGMDELLARLRAALRRMDAGPRDEPVIATPHFDLDLSTRRATVGAEEVHLTPKEWQMVEVLARAPGRLVTQRELLREVWGPQYRTETEYLRVFMASLRRKLEPDPRHPRYLVTDPGVGYRLVLG
ncbi:MAG: response regulator [Acidimicrobiales bacterium]